jgi:hypothetical protein
LDFPNAFIDGLAAAPASSPGVIKKMIRGAAAAAEDLDVGQFEGLIEAMLIRTFCLRRQNWQRHSKHVLTLDRSVAGLFCPGLCSREVGRSAPPEPAHCLAAVADLMLFAVIASSPAPRTTSGLRAAAHHSELAASASAEWWARCARSCVSRCVWCFPGRDMLLVTTTYEFAFSSPSAEP